MERYTLTEADVARVKEERGYKTAGANEVLEGDEYPMVVVRQNDDGSVNGQVFLDGPDTLWVTSVDLNVASNEPPSEPVTDGDSELTPA